MALLLGVILVVAYGAWKQSLSTNSARPPEPSPVIARKLPESDADRPPTEQPLNALPVHAPPPVYGGAVNDNVPAEQMRPPQSTQPTQALKTIRLADLLVNGAVRQQSVQTSQSSVSRDLSGAAADVQAGDVLRLTGWIHRISRDAERAYRLDLRSSQEDGSPGLMAVIPHPDQASESPATKAQLQSVRTFITQRLLRQREPSTRGSVMRRPISVQLTGQLIHFDPPQRKEPRGATAHWEIRPVLEIQFASQPGSSARSRSE